MIPTPQKTGDVILEGGSPGRSLPDPLFSPPDVPFRTGTRIRPGCTNIPSHPRCTGVIIRKNAEFGPEQSRDNRRE